MPNDADYFMKMASKAKPLQDALSKPKKAAAAPKMAKAPEPPQLVKSHTVYQDDDYEYMTKVNRQMVKRLSPKSVMGKSSPKR